MSADSNVRVDLYIAAGSSRSRAVSLSEILDRRKK